MTFKDYVSSISADDIGRAIAEIDRTGIPKNRRSTKWAVKLDSRLYPPKYLLSLASKIVTGKPIPPTDHSGGEQTNHVFRDLGFNIVPLGSNTKED